MSSDPRLIHSRLDQLASDCLRVACSATELARCAQQLQSQIDEHVANAERSARETLDQAASALRLCQSTNASAQRCMDRTQLQIRTTEQARISADLAFRNAESARARWVSEVARARRRVEIARSWIARATAEREAAERSLAEAHRKLAACISSLSSCMLRTVTTTDANGKQRTVAPDCSSERLAVEAAEQAVAAAEIRLEAAQEDLRRAEAEFADAEADLLHCETCLRQAEMAVFIARSGLLRAEIAITEAVRAAEFASEALATSIRAIRLAESGVENANQALRLASSSASDAAEGRIFVSRIRNGASELELVGLAGVQGIGARMDALLWFNLEEGL
jgi:uncharacterized protein (UPF0212 family)